MAILSPDDLITSLISFGYITVTATACLLILDICLKYFFQSGLCSVVDWPKVQDLLLYVKLAKLLRGNSEETLKIFIDLAIKHPTPCYIRFGLTRLAYVDKPEDLQIVLNSSQSLEKGRFYEFLKPVFGEGVGTAPVSKWKKHRRQMNPVFSSRLLRSFFEIFNKESEKLIETLKKESSADRIIDLNDYILTLTFRIIYETMVNRDSKGVFAENEITAFQNAITGLDGYIGERIWKVWLHPNFIFKIYSKLFTRYFEYNAFITKFTEKVIKYRKQIYEENKIRLLPNSEAQVDVTSEQEMSFTFIDKLLELNEQGAGNTDEDLRDEAMTMLVAGSLTTWKVECFALLMLAMHTDIQDKAYAEVVSVLGKEDKPVTMDDVEKMPFLDQCIKETMRLFSVFPLFLRLASEDIKLDSNFVIEKDTDIIIAPVSVHRNPNIYPNPEIWNPDNFSVEASEKRHKYSFLGFSAGLRGCIGGKYAMLSMKPLLSLMLKKFRITTDVKLSDMKLKYSILVESAHGYKVKLYPRSGN